ncbi:MAG: hypothetical protein K0S75_871 [Clostridia bacterium]|jgi:hypothetical protein|nr:hypothetical protein [Clostridia bacterium]
MFYKYNKLAVRIAIFILAFSIISVGAIGNTEEVTRMNNKYCNLDVNKNISEEYIKINDGFGKVEADINATNNRVNEIITTPVDGTIAAQEIIDARGGEATLGLRLDGNAQDISDINANLTEYAKKIKYMNQADYVELIKKHTNYNRLRFRMIAENSYQVCVDNGNNYVSYGFIKDANDDFIKLGACDIGLIGGLVDTGLATNLTGTWNTASPPDYYTTIAESTFTVNVTGTKLVFRHRADSRGGIFEFVIDGDTANPITISTWNLTDTGGVRLESEIVRGLNNVEHTIVATYKGADPNHAPTGGTARGWINGTDALVAGTIQGYDEDGIVKTATLLNEASNKEIAVDISYNGVHRFNPEHEMIGTTFANDIPVFTVDGVKINEADLPLNEWVEGASFQLFQDNYIEYTEFPGVKLATWFITHSIGLDGVVEYSGYLRAEADTVCNTIYPLMLPVEYSTLNRAITSLGDSRTSQNDGTDYYFTENDNMKSGCFISSVNNSYIAAGTITEPLSTMRIGETVGKAEFPIRFWQRLNYPKLYFSAAELWDVNTLDTYRWGGKIAVANINKIMAYVKG